MSKAADIANSLNAAHANAPIKGYSPRHLKGLRRFAIGITVITILGHAFLGFEQSYAQPLVALATAYIVQILLEIATAWSERRAVRFAGGVGRLVDFLLSAHIAGLSVAMLLYFNDRLWVVAFAVAVAVCSKSIFRAPIDNGSRHFFNPSNFGISVTLLAFPWVGLGMPWQFAESTSGITDWLLPLIFFALGSLLHIRFTGRIYVVVGFIVAFAIQAMIRSLFFDASLSGALMPATGVLAWIYTFYMVPDPSTTPENRLAQLAFGAAVPAVYFVFVALHVVFGLFFALTIVCGCRGLVLYLNALTENRSYVPS